MYAEDFDFSKLEDFYECDIEADPKEYICCSEGETLMCDVVDVSWDSSSNSEECQYECECCKGTPYFANSAYAEMDMMGCAPSGTFVTCRSSYDGECKSWMHCDSADKVVGCRIDDGPEITYTCCSEGDTSFGCKVGTFTVPGDGEYTCS